MKTMARKLGLACPALLLLMASGAQAGQETQPKKDEAAAEDKPKSDNNSTGKRAEDIVTQPVRDVGLSKKEIPPILISAVESPYAAPKGKCATITAELTELNEALGPDFGSGTKENENKVGKIASAGGSWIVNSLIPFRGLVREVSGAAPAERRLAAAVSAGLARRGYLRGLAQTRGCKAPK